MDVPEDVQVDLESNSAWSDSVKNEREDNLRRESSHSEKATRQMEGSGKERREAGGKVGGRGGKCQLGQETKGTGAQETLSEGNNRNRLMSDIQRHSLHSKRKARDDLMISNPGKVARTETNIVPRKTLQEREKGFKQKRRTGDASHSSELSSLIKTMIERERKKMNEALEIRFETERKNMMEAYETEKKRMMEERETERRDQNRQVDLLEGRIEDLETERRNQDQRVDLLEERIDELETERRDRDQQEDL